jgi:hypothetical protein
MTMTLIWLPLFLVRDHGTYSLDTLTSTNAVAENPNMPPDNLLVVQEVHD